MTRPTVLFLGARSDIARATAHRFARAGHDVVLAARDPATVQADADDLRVRHQIDARVVAFDALSTETHAAFAHDLSPRPDIVICCVGLLGEQRRNETDQIAAVEVMRSNFEGPASILAAFAELFAAAGKGILVGVSSVAGERGRASNYVYGASKAGFTAFLSGLRNRLTRIGVRVITVLPGFVDTAMTRGMELPKRLTASPEQVAERVYRAVTKGGDVIYVKPIWRPIMLIIRHIPEPIFKKLKL